MVEDQSPADRGHGRELSRREFVQAVGVSTFAASIPLAGLQTVLGGSVKANLQASSVGETPVARFFRTLSNDQRTLICFPFEHPLRTRVENNWAIVKPRIGDLTTEQQALCCEIFKNLCSEDGHERFTRQMNDDAGGFENYHVALFGAPGTDQPFEWVLTGRHNTLRADGRCHEGAAIRGPLFYGHAVPTRGQGRGVSGHAGNVWQYQTEQANAILSSLDGRQRAQALLTPAAGPDSVRSQENAIESRGLAVAGLDVAQKQMVQQLLRDLIRPFRSFDAEEIQNCLRESSGADELRLTFYPTGHHGPDQAWETWKLEGPAFVWHFHGTPHVHSWLSLTRRVVSV
ncbi:DUF3500 domain-containing protein [Singulisphaera acidiphila]|uniref:DUF3500 domain-containing protein n=1 Tax=Singulisphaera acidiphila (strain ATCC BAA-1392 / DSM 18658 / VKM B-2454 / MOB10) TaxID=886293 RepID=L0DDR5_SINAD|nr:DUF3500 domain-containing protein [Singulisphaera acidiphila]AGA27519.1 Protein of unknown function (DUF3500) [Singulisphaera acidiphila DSM 18658]